jgi:preprotein translocase subunit SecE
MTTDMSVPTTKSKLAFKKGEVQRVTRSPKSPKKKEKRDFFFDSFEIIYKLDDEHGHPQQVGRYMTSPSTRLFGDGKTAVHKLTWPEREDLDHAIGDVIDQTHTVYEKK